MNFWDFFWFLVWVYVVFAYLMLLIAVFADIFRDSGLNGWMKAVWILFLIAVPFLTALVYMIARGRRRDETWSASPQIDDPRNNGYLQPAVVSSPAEEIAKAKVLFDNGSITQVEFDGLKAQMLAVPNAR